MTRLSRGQRMMMGSETEYGIVGGWSVAKAEGVQLAAVSAQPCLPSVKGGAYLANGARVYVDQHTHNELASPETHDPVALVTHELAGRLLMAKAASELGLALLCSNLDPSTGNTWGTHENYECRQRFISTQMAQLYTHLATRIIYCGAGGLDPDHPGVRPVLSPRACRIVSSFYCRGVVRRALVFVKPESYGRGDRLHVFCGESLLSHAANYLKYATTALVARCLHTGYRIGPGSFAQSPIRVLRRLNRDLDLSARFLMEDGRSLSALEIQEAILDDVYEYIGELPAWAPVAVARWGTILAELKSGHPGTAKKLDWLVYLKALTAMQEEYGYSLEEIRRLNKAIRAELGRPGQHPIRERFREFRAAANELYVRLHILGKESLFGWLEERGWLDHRLPEITDAAIQRATSEPPTGRAANRSVLIKKYAGRDGFSASWDKLFDAPTRTLTISCAATWDGLEKWQAAPSPTDDPRVAAAMALFRAGKYHDTIKALAGTELADFGSNAWDVAETLCLSYARLGMKPETLQARTSMAHLATHRFHELAIFLSAVNNLGLSPPLRDMLPIIQVGESTLSQSAGDDYFLFAFNQYKARVLSLQGNLDQAQWMFRTILALPKNQHRTRMMARTRCFYAETLRLMGRHEEAARALALATERHQTENMGGDLADHSLPMRAKLGTDEEAEEALKQAESLQRTLGNDIGLARVLCLKARRMKIGTDYTEVCDLQHRVTALQDCPVATRVVARWDNWVTSAGSKVPVDYWGL